jgi:hypothetical protein
VLTNTSGSGKTRLILDGLCRHWGFYFVANQGPDGIGSRDFSTIMDMDNSAGYKLAQSQKMTNSDAMQHMKEKAHHRLRQLLLARFILLKLFVEVARSNGGNLHEKNYRRAWVLLQILPMQIFDEDIFVTMSDTLRLQGFDDSVKAIKKHFRDLQDILGLAMDSAIGKLKKSPFYCVLDESQLLTSARMGEFMSGDGTLPRPLMREVYHIWNDVLPPEQMLLICSGTGINYQSLYESVASGALTIPYHLCNDIGAFADRDAQTKYIQYYLGERPGLSWRAFLDRAWGWCRGRYLFESSRGFWSLITITRYRSTAALIGFILMSGYQSPHTVLNRYVKAFTNFAPTDGQAWLADEPPPLVNLKLEAIQPLGFERMSA